MRRENTRNSVSVSVVAVLSAGLFVLVSLPAEAQISSLADRLARLPETPQLGADAPPVSRTDVLDRFAACAVVVGDLIEDGFLVPGSAPSEFVQTMIPAGFWGCVYNHGWPGRPFPDAAIYTGLVDSVLNRMTDDHAYARMFHDGTRSVARYDRWRAYMACSAMKSVELAAWLAMSKARQTAYGNLRIDCTQPQ